MNQDYEREWSGYDCTGTTPTGVKRKKGEWLTRSSKRAIRYLAIGDIAGPTFGLYGCGLLTGRPFAVQAPAWIGIIFAYMASFAAWSELSRT